jgi:hypothetical protein
MVAHGWWLLMALALVTEVRCMGTEGSKNNGATAARWVTAARGAQYYEERFLVREAEALKQLSGDGYQRATQLLDAMAATPDTADGVRAAAGLLAKGLPGFRAAGRQPPGPDPDQQRVRQAALALMHGRLYRIGTSIKDKPIEQAVDLLRATDELDAVLAGATIGIDIMQELDAALGDRFNEAWKRKAAH